MKTKIINSPLWSSPLGALTSLLSPAGKNAHLSIIIYHRVLPEPDALLGGTSDVAKFDLHLKYLTKHFNIIPLQEAVQQLRSATLPSRAACITFDDGYADNAEIALPILQKYGVHATFFIAAGFIDGGIMWNDKVIELIRRAPGDSLDLTQIGFGQHKIDTLPQRRKVLFSLIDSLKYLPAETRLQQVEKLSSLISATLPSNLMMTSTQVKSLYDSGMGVGGHTINHPILARLKNNEAAYSEIANGKEILEGIIRAPVRLFAFPNGKPTQDYLPDHIEIIKKAGFEAAVSTAWGAAKSDSDLYQLPRFTPWASDYLKFMLQMSRNMLKPIDVV